MARYWRRALAIVIPACLSGLPAAADDSSRGVALLAIETVPPATAFPKTAEVAIEGDAVSLTFVLGSFSGKRIVVRGPKFAWLGEADTYSDRSFSDLRITWNGAPVALDRSAVASLGAEDITGKVREAGFDPLDIAFSPPVVERPEGAAGAAFDVLLRENAIKRLGDVYTANWSAQQSFNFSPESAGGKLTLRYRALPGFVLTGWETVPPWLHLDDYCVAGVDALRGLVAAVSKAADEVVLQTYTVPVEIGGRVPPFVEARLRMEHAASVFCGLGGKPVVVAPGHTAGSTASVRTGAFRLLTISRPQ